MTELETAVRAALAALDTKNDEHWTENGMPRLDALGSLKLSRAELTAIAPLFNRTNAVLASIETAKVEQPTGQPPIVQAPPSETQLAELEALVVAAQAEVQEAEKLKADAERRVAQAQVKADTLINAMERARPSHAHKTTMDIRQVLERGKEVRAEKAGIASELRRVGVTEAMLRGSSRLDQAMARKRGFGTARPNLLPQAAGK